MASQTIIGSPRRISAELSTLRLRAPYVNYDLSSSSIKHSHSHPDPSLSQSSGKYLPIPINNPSSDQPVSRWKSLKRGYGSRHIFDVADFSLWNEELQTFRWPEKAEMQWILNFYQAKEVLFFYPLLIILTDAIPNPLPLTVACVATRFVPTNYTHRQRQVNTAYATPRIPDPIPFRVAKWSTPDKEQMNQILKALAALANVKAVSWFGPYSYVELHVGDGRVYNRHSLPGRVAGKTTLYHHSEADFWSDTTELALSRVINPQATATGPSLQDRTNYLLEGIGTLQPGVRLANSLNSNNDTFTDLERSTSAGVQLRNQTGQVVVTGANHGFVSSDDVYHPSTLNGSKIGEVTERWLAQDVAMITLIPAVRFTNSEYFEATPPQRLLRSNQLNDGLWCSVDGMSTGIVFLHCTGAKAGGINLNVTNGTAIETVEFYTERLFSAFGPTGGDAAEGICGAPIVEEEDLALGIHGGGVYGLYRMGNLELAISLVLDDIIDAGWELY